MCQRRRFKGGGLAGLQQNHIYRSQELRTEMGSMQQVLFRFQLQPFLINWLLSSPANPSSAFDQWPHAQMGPRAQHNAINALSVFPCAFFFFLLSCMRTHTSTSAKNVRMRLINAHSAWVQDLHYFMLRSLNWSQDKMISGGIFHVVIFLFPDSEPLGIHLQGETLSLNACFCDPSFDLEMRNIFKKRRGWCCITWWWVGTWYASAPDLICIWRSVGLSLWSQ